MFNSKTMIMKTLQNKINNNISNGKIKINNFTKNYNSRSKSDKKAHIDCKQNNNLNSINTYNKYKLRETSFNKSPKTKLIPKNDSLFLSDKNNESKYINEKENNDNNIRKEYEKKLKDNDLKMKVFLQENIKSENKLKNYENKIKEQENEINKLKKNIKELTNNLENIKNNKLSEENNLSKLNKTLEEKDSLIKEIETNYSNTKEELENLNEKLNSTEQELKDTNENYMTIQKEKDVLININKEKDNKLKKLNDKNLSIKNELKTLKEQLNYSIIKDNKNTELQIKNKELEEKIDELTNDIAELKNINSNIKNSLIKEKEENNIMKEKFKNIEKENKELKRKNENLNQKLLDIEQEIKDKDKLLKEKNDEYNNLLNSKNKELTKSKEINDQKIKEFDELKQEKSRLDFFVKEKVNEINELKKQINNYEENIGSLNQEKKVIENKKKDIEKRERDLDEKYNSLIRDKNEIENKRKEFQNEILRNNKIKQENYTLNIQNQQLLNEIGIKQNQLNELNSNIENQTQIINNNALNNGNNISNQLNNNLKNNSNNYNNNNFNNNNFNNNNFMNNNMMNNLIQNFNNNSNFNNNFMNNNMMNNFIQNFNNNSNFNNMMNNNNNNNLNNNTQGSKKRDSHPSKSLTPTETYGEPTLIGLNNIGATCFMNAILQCFSQTKGLTDYFLLPKNKNKIINNNIAIKNRNEPQLSPIYLDLIKKLWEKNSSSKSFSPTTFMQTIEEMNPLFKQGQPGDSKDFIIFILEQFHKELKKSVENNIFSDDTKVELNQYDRGTTLQYFFNDFIKETSKISDLFFGIIETTNICLNCKQNYNSKGLNNPICYDFQRNNCIIFPLEDIKNYKNSCMQNNGNFMYQNNIVTLTECFYYYQKTDTFTGPNQNYCNICKQLNDSLYTTKLYTAPNILILILNRGKDNMYDVKLDFTERINITDFILEKEKPIIMYDLYGVITHIGQSGPNVHFVASCKSPVDKRWYRYNDAIVYEINNVQKDIINFQCPYILFYQKV